MVYLKKSHLFRKIQNYKYINIAKNYDPDESYSCQPRGCYRESFSMSVAAVTVRLGPFCIRIFEDLLRFCSKDFLNSYIKRNYFKFEDIYSMYYVASV